MSNLLILTFYLTFAFSQNKNDDSTQIYNSFSFVTSNKKEFTLSKADFPIKQNKSIFSSLLNLFSRVKAKENPRQWYYVHIYDIYLSTVQKYVKIQPNDQIIKNTFVLYLTSEQIEQIAPYCLFKKLESSYKLDEVTPFNSTDYLYVKTSTDYHFSPSNYFTIDNKINSDTYIIKVNNRCDIQKVASILTNSNEVQRVSTYKKPVPENNINIGRIQRNDEPLTRGGYLNLLKIDRYVHKHGLTGEGQIVTIIDTDIDFRHPMFRDDNVEVEFNKELPDHRKIFYYYSKVDMDEWKKNISEANHGTHVAGTLAGKSIVDLGNESINSMFDGSAPDAKLIYAGLYGVTTAEEVENIMKSHGSRISSNSWGDDVKYVDGMNHEWGSVAYRNPEFLFLFAAGNHGQGEIGYTVIDPGGSKNVLAVAYSTSPVFQGSNQYVMHKIGDPSFIFYIFSMFVYDLYVTDFIGTKKGESSIIAVDTRNLTEESINEMCENINGPHVTIYYGDTESDSFINEKILSHCSNDLQSNGMLITTNVTLIEDLIASKEKVAIVFEALVEQINSVQRGNRGSIGPGNKGIMKPDVIAPGDYIISGSSYGSDIEKPCDDFIHCGLASKSGSSMATPNVAGAAALISQYFKSGKWIDEVDIDGITMRAMIINSARHPSESLSPDLVFGHGFVDVSRALPLENEFGVRITRQGESRPSIGENGHLTATINVKSECTLQVTLSYLDAMLHENSPIPLTRDLDLVVVSPGGSKYNGDHFAKDTQHLSTNEKVIIDAYSKGNYTIHIFAGKFADAKLSKEDLRQEFSVVATGNIENGYIDFEEATVAPCKKNDPDHPDHCLCTSTQIGPSCKTTITNIEGSTSFYTKLKPMEISRAKFTTKNNISSIKSYQSSAFTFPTLWISKTCHLSLGEYEINAKVGNMKESEIEIPFQTNEICVAIFNNNYKTDVFFHVEVYQEPDKCPDCGKDEGNSTTHTENVGPGEDSNKAEKGVSKKLFYIVTGVLAAIVVALLVLIIIFVIRRKRLNPNEFKSEQLTSLNSPILQTF